MPINTRRRFMPNDVKDAVMKAVASTPQHVRDVVRNVEASTQTSGRQVRSAIRELVDDGELRVTLDWKLAKKVYP
jgi:hypothetical protein